MNSRKYQNVLILKDPVSLTLTLLHFLGYQEVIASLSDPNTPETERPEIYRTTKKAWGAPTNPAAKAYNPVYTGAGAKSGMMANGVGFLETIKKQRSEIKK